MHISRETCTADQYKQIDKVWGDAKMYADALKSWVPGKDYQPAIDMYLGKGSTSRGRKVVGTDRQKRIEDTARKAGGLWDGRSEHGNAQLFVGCNEDPSRKEKPCELRIEGFPLAAQMNQDFSRKNFYLTLCPVFFSGPMPHSRLVNLVKAGKYDPGKMETWEESQAGALFHELMHMGKLVTDPRAMDEAYGAEACFDMAKKHDVKRTTLNADSFMLAAAAIYAQKTFKLKNPPLPGSRAEAALTVRDAAGTAKVPKMRDISNITPQDYKPSGVGERMKDGTFRVDPSKWISMP